MPVLLDLQYKKLGRYVERYECHDVKQGESCIRPIQGNPPQTGKKSKEMLLKGPV